MQIVFSDHLGVQAITVNEYGISFDNDKGIAIFEDEDGKEYRISLFHIHRIVNE